MNRLCVFDFETDSSDPTTCSPVQLSSVMVDSRRLKIIKDSEFNGFMRPPDFDDKDYVENHRSTIKFHADLTDASIDDIVSKWYSYPSQKTTWEQFVEYVDKYNWNQTKKTIFTAPNPAGFNILDFDMIIVNRLCRKYGPMKDNRQNLFFGRDVRDVMHLSSYWLSPIKEVKSYNFDTLRAFFGMKTEGAHDALVDCKQTANLLIKYLKLANTLADTIKFKGVFAKK